jgi:hypothetical protein
MRVNVYRRPSEEDPYAAEDGPALLGWFDPDKAEVINEDTRWDGNNRVGVMSGIQASVGHQCLYRTAGGRWVRYHNARNFYNGPEYYEYITDEVARNWLLSNGSDAVVEKYFGEIEEEAGPGPGRPVEGVAINTRLRPDQIEAADEIAEAQGKKRAEVLRDLVDVGLRAPKLALLLADAQAICDASGKLKVPSGQAGYLGGVQAAIKVLNGDLLTIENLAARAKARATS